jgi:hypothetical protein
MWWLREKMEREGLSYLPPSLALRKEAADALEAAERAPSERVLRDILSEINRKIRDAMSRPIEGPPLNLAPIDIELIVRKWRQRSEPAS